MTTSTEALPVLLLRARETSLAHIRPILQDHGLTEPQWRVLYVLYRHPDVNAQKLARESCVLSPSLSRILSRFAVDGLILRNISSADQRSVAIKLSAKGKRLYHRIHPKLEAQFQRLKEQSGADSIRQLNQLLQEFISSAPTE